MDKTYTMPDICERYGKTRQTIQTYIAKGYLHGNKEGTKWTFTKKDLEEFEETMNTEPVKVYSALEPGGEIVKGNDYYKIIAIYPDGCTVHKLTQIGRTPEFVESNNTQFIPMDAIKHFEILH